MQAIRCGLHKIAIRGDRWDLSPTALYFVGVGSVICTTIGVGCIGAWRLIQDIFSGALDQEPGRLFTLAFLACFVAAFWIVGIAALRWAIMHWQRPLLTVDRPTNEIWTSRSMVARASDVAAVTIEEFFPGEDKASCGVRLIMKSGERLTVVECPWSSLDRIAASLADFLAVPLTRGAYNSGR